MNGSKRWLLTLLVTALMCCLALTVSAQGTSSGTLVLGQPLPQQITAGTILNYDYVLSKPSEVTLQALGDTAQPTIAILQNGAVIAQQNNTAGALTISLVAPLNAGSYVVQVGTVNNTAGLVVLVDQSEAAITTTALTPANPLSGVVDTGSPLAFYTFNALAEPAFLYVDSGVPTSGVSIRLVNTTSGQVSGQIELDLLGVRLRIPAGSAAYQVAIQQSGAGGGEPFTICLAAVSTGGCEAGSAAAQPPPVVVVQPIATEELTPVVVDCTVTGAAPGAVNIRQSASTGSIIIDALPNGVSANVIGISPDKAFYNILYNGENGWVAAAVVTTSGNCEGILVINPPPIIAPTQAPAPPPTQVAAQPSGPCTITMKSPTFVYTKTDAVEDDLFDQVQSGVQLNPNGRLGDNSWWRLPYFGTSAWLETKLLGSQVQVSGNCNNLPVVAAPQ